MESIFDDPFFIATVRAQTRAMNKFGESVRLDHNMTKMLYRAVKVRYRPRMDMSLLLDTVLDLNEPFTNEAERGGYKIAIGMAMYEVGRAKRREFGEFERSRPFAPR